MDGALSSSRDRSGSSSGGGGGGYYGPSGGHRHGGRGRGGRGGGYRSRGHHPHRHHGGHHPYHSGGRHHRRGGRGGGGGGRGSRPGNRFAANATTSVDPRTAMLRQLSAMVAKMGDLVGAADGAAALPPTENENGNDSVPQRPVVRAVAKNASDLIGVLCSEGNAPLFLRYENEDGTEGGAKAADDDGEANGNGAAAPAALPKASLKADELAGPLATLLTSCALTLPTQTPSHAALTLGVDRAAPANYAGFAKRCLDLAARRLGRDLDATLGCVGGGGVSGDGTIDENLAGNGWDGASTIPVDAYLRCKLTLRYLALLGRVDVVVGYDESADGAGMADHLDGHSHSVAGLINMLLEAAERSSDAAAHATDADALRTSYRNASAILVSLILSTLPYALPYLPRDYVEGSVLSRLDAILASGYDSPYRPGVGISALLLSGPQVEDKVAGAMEEDEEDDSDDDDDDDDDENDASGVCCDTLQDLARTVKTVVATYYDRDGAGAATSSLAGTRFALPADSPWSDLADPTAETMMDDAEDESSPKKSAAYSGESLRILPLVAGSSGGDTKDSAEDSLSLATAHLLSLRYDGSISQEQSSAVAIRIPNLDGVVYGRLAIFGLGDEEDEDEEEDQTPRNPEQEAYTKGFSLLDRYFLSEAVRDALICHRPTVTATGAERGSCRDVAEQVFAIGHLFVPVPKEGDSDVAGVASATNIARGVEYGIVETILSLILQANRREEGSDAAGSPLGHLYLSRVFLEMTKLQPTLMPRSIAAAISALFEDFLPSLAPSARASLADWLALHLTNTDYQWPSAYWSHWTPYAQAVVDAKQRNSRGEFVIDALRSMMELQGSPSAIVSGCLPSGSALVNAILPDNKSPDDEANEILQGLEKDLEDRIWLHNDDPDAVREYIVGDEFQESNTTRVGEHTSVWWRTSVVVKAALRPAKKDLARAQKAVSTAASKQAGEADAMEEEDLDEAADDVVVDSAETIARYKPVFLAALAKDVQAYEEGQDARGEAKADENIMLELGEANLLRGVECVASYSPAVLEACIEALVKNGIVSSKGVLKWALGDCDTPGASSVVVETSVAKHWYKYALLAFRTGLAMALSDDTGSDGGMIIDRGGDETGPMEDEESKVSRHVSKALAFVTTLLNYATDRVCTILVRTDESGRRKITPFEADLIDGMKLFVTTSQSQLRASLKNDKLLIESATGKELANIERDIEECLARSDFTGRKLSSRCRQECSALTHFVEVLLKSIEGA